MGGAGRVDFPKLTDKQKAQVKRWILGKDPRQYGLDFALWTRKIVQYLIREKMGIELCLTSVGKLLASLEITPQKPLRRAYERDPEAVQSWLTTTYPALKKRAKKQGAQIFFRFLSRICGWNRVQAGGPGYGRGPFPWRDRCESRRSAWSPLGFYC
jgi:hypothetical protein